MYNYHVWATVHPHGGCSIERQQRFFVNVWAGMIHSSLLGPYLFSRLPRWTNIPHLPPAGVSCFTATYYGKCLRHDMFISMRKHQFIFLGMNETIWIRMASPENLVARIGAAAADVRDMPQMFQCVRDSMHRRCESLYCPCRSLR